MKSHFELTPAEYEHARQGHLQRRRRELVAEHLRAVRPGELVLEVGCGPGDVVGALARARPDARFVGVDLDAAMVGHAREAHPAPNASFECLDLVAAPLGLRARLVFGIDVLHHVRPLDPFVAAVGALLADGGRWLAIEPNSRNPYVWLHQERMRRAGLDEDHFRRRAFERACARAGLHVEACATAFLVPGAVQRVPRFVASAERLLERVPVLGGSVVYRLSAA